MPTGLQQAQDYYRWYVCACVCVFMRATIGWGVGAGPIADTSELWPPAGLTGAASVGACKCPEEFYQTSGSSASNEAATCVACDPATALCDDVGLTLPEVETAHNYWRAHPQATRFMRCLRDDICNSGLPVAVSDSDADSAGVWTWQGTRYRFTNCTEGYSGVLCQACAQGYGSSLFDSLR